MKPEASYTWEKDDAQSDIFSISDSGDCWVEIIGDNPGTATINALKDGTECGSFEVTCVQIHAKAQATSPTVQVRKKFGVGEAVDITLLPASLTSPSLSLTQGSSDLTAYGAVGLLVCHYSAETAKIKASFSGGDIEVELDIIEPEGITLEHDSVVDKDATPLYLHYKAKIYLTPPDVKFVSVSTKEETVKAETSGYFDYQKGKSHTPGGYEIYSTHVDGKGTECTALDNILGSTNGPTYANGDFTWNIPWVWKSSDGGVDDRELATLTHLKTLRQENGQWELKISKAGIDDSAP